MRIAKPISTSVYLQDIEKMIADAEKYAEEDKKVKDKVDTRNGLESYAYSLKSQIDDDDKLGYANHLGFLSFLGNFVAGDCWGSLIFIFKTELEDADKLGDAFFRGIFAVFRGLVLFSIIYYFLRCLFFKK